MAPSPGVRGEGGGEGEEADAKAECGMLNAEFGVKPTGSCLLQHSVFSIQDSAFPNDPHPTLIRGPEDREREKTTVAGVGTGSQACALRRT